MKLARGANDKNVNDPTILAIRPSAKNGLFAKGFATIAIAALVSSGAGEL